MKLLTKFNTEKLIWLFAMSQVVVITIFLAHRGETFISFNFYLQTVKYTTLLLLIISILTAIQEKKNLLKFDLMKYSFVVQFLILYFVMLIHTDIKAINSPTILLMLILSFLMFSNPLNYKKLNLLVIYFSILNFGLVLLQILKIIPVAQDNVREGLAIIGDRPTGLLFNAFAMGYASVITFLICLYFIKLRIYKWLNLTGVFTSLASLVFSGTRTPFILLLIFGLLILIQDFNLIKKNWKILSILIPFSIIAIPILVILIGKITDQSSLINLNGRTQLWSCVTSRWQDFLPFGVGVQASFPNGFCSDDPWFSKLRHPENMFLLNYVESGILGVIGLVTLFVISYIYSGRLLKNGSALALGITSTFLLSSIFYVPLFHYTPFLEGRTADRGVFNFFLVTCVWMSALSFKIEEKIRR